MHARVWYDGSFIPTEQSQPNESKSATEVTEGNTTTSSAASTETSFSHNLLDRQRRPRVALLSWHCLTLLSATNVTTVDLELHAEVVSLATGCLMRK